MANAIHISDDIFHEAQAEATRRGVAVDEFVEQLLRDMLNTPPRRGKRVQFPILRSDKPPSITPEDVNRALEQDYLDEDFERGRST
jgi:hypothetical protein